ncbi:helix-turn-helix domain-containing protein [Fusibacter paucivorans]|uniref:Helix-turn-helix domain-containing protein n=1 Tax=Fusibacter paucivorans TaxID=76009 RepID=A0ABS5PLE8_9FIRM|nr:helix-turn-helix domain-containing protein [Fusibacter paucivorans]MBS7525985.1 helix-turn-helix domain-containing protein [Fusibacter paucivorans]
MNRTDYHVDVQQFNWGTIEWLHEPSDSPHHHLSLARVVISPKAHQNKHFHVGEEQMLFVLSGKGIFINNGVERHIESTAFQYVAPFAEHVVINESAKEDLVLMVIYAPISLSPLDMPKVSEWHVDVTEHVNLELIQNVTEELSQLLKLDMHYLRGGNCDLTLPEFCITCARHRDCALESEQTPHDGIRQYYCPYGVSQIAAPLVLNERQYGTLWTERFVLGGGDYTRNSFGDFGNEAEQAAREYSRFKTFIKSRIYVVFDHMTIAAQFINMVHERRVLESVLLDKENELLRKTQEQLKLKDRLLKTGARNAHDSFLIDSSRRTPKMMYPYALEMALENALVDEDALRVTQLLDEATYLTNYDLKTIMEMIVVLSRVPARKTKDFEKTARLMRKYEEALTKRDVEDRKGLLKTFCIECLSDIKDSYAENDGTLIERVNQYLELHYREPLNLQSVATHFYISPNYLSAKFNEVNQCSFTDYITDLRIDAAKVMLLNSHMKIIDIAHRSGFQNVSYFTKCFKLREGMTPGKFRMQNRQLT